MTLGRVVKSPGIRAVAAVALACALMLAAGCGGKRASAPTTPVQNASTTGSASAPASTANTTPSATPTPTATAEPPSPENRTPKTTTNPNLPDPALDAFVAEQYPGYRVEKRVSFPAQYDRGRLGVNYLLVNKRRPEFRLLVSVAQRKSGENPSANSSYMVSVGRVLTNDTVFSVDARTQNRALTVARQNAIIDAFIPKKPAADAMAFDGVFDEDGGFNFEIEFGTGALERAMQDTGLDAKYSAVGTFPNKTGPKVVLTVQHN